jgi:hypothetical protein
MEKCKEEKAVENHVFPISSFEIFLPRTSRYSATLFTLSTLKCYGDSSLNVFDDGAVLRRSILWTLSIVSMFCNHNVSRDGYSLVIR